MFYLGQSVIHKKYYNSKPVAAIVSGFNTHGAPLLVTITEDGELKKHDPSFLVDLYPVRKKNTKSPTGYALYTGKLAKIGFIANNVKMKLPEDEKLAAELKATQKLIDIAP